MELGEIVKSQECRRHSKCKNVSICEMYTIVFFSATGSAQKHFSQFILQIGHRFQKLMKYCD